MKEPLSDSYKSAITDAFVQGAPPRLKRFLAARYPHLDQRVALFQAHLDGQLSEELLPTTEGKGQEMSKQAEQAFGSVSVKKAADQLSTKRREGAHAKSGQPVLNPLTGRPTECASQLDHAKAGVLMKHLAQRAGLPVSLSEWERELLAESAHDDRWSGDIDGSYQKAISGGRVKALLDDATSGGLYVTPEFFDSSLVSYPLLSGELFPLVDILEVPRGRRIEGSDIQTPTVSWGQGDNTEAALYDTTSLLTQISTSVYGLALAVEIGRDFLSDSAVDVGSRLTQLVGERLAAELDKVIATGNGTSQPTGLTQASSLTTVSPDNTTSGPPTLNDYSSLMFSVGKQYRMPSMRCAFVSNDTSYQRSRGIKVDTASPSTDQRPVMSDVSSFNSYATLGWPHKIQNDLANGTAFFVALARYRMYRRAGLEIRFETGGRDLARRNVVLMVARARFGGQLMDSSAAAKWTAGQS